MKKILALVLALVMVMSMAACTPNNNDATTESTTESTNAVVAADALEVLNTVWAAMPEEGQFPCGGGSGDNMSMEGPGVVDITDADYLANVLHVPAELHTQIVGAASMMHMMNSNTFTGAAYQVTGDMATFTTALTEGIKNTQWMCGFPEKVLVVTVGDYVVAVFGYGELVDIFQTQLTTAYETAVVVVNEAL